VNQFSTVASELEFTAKRMSQRTKETKRNANRRLRNILSVGGEVGLVSNFSVRLLNANFIMISKAEPRLSRNMIFAGVVITEYGWRTCGFSAVTRKLTQHAFGELEWKMAS
jgi:hypothetical protein